MKQMYRMQFVYLFIFCHLFILRYPRCSCLDSGQETETQQCKCAAWSCVTLCVSECVFMCVFLATHTHTRAKEAKDVLLNKIWNLLSLQDVTYLCSHVSSGCKIPKRLVTHFSLSNTHTDTLHPWSEQIHALASFINKPFSDFSCPQLQKPSSLSSPTEHPLTCHL